MTIKATFAIVWTLAVVAGASHPALADRKPIPELYKARCREITTDDTDASLTLLDWRRMSPRQQADYLCGFAANTPVSADVRAYIAWKIERCYEVVNVGRNTSQGRAYAASMPLRTATSVCLELLRRIEKEDAEKGRR